MRSVKDNVSTLDAALQIELESLYSDNQRLGPSFKETNEKICPTVYKAYLQSEHQSGGPLPSENFLVKDAK